MNSSEAYDLSIFQYISTNCQFKIGIQSLSNISLFKDTNGYIYTNFTSDFYNETLNCLILGNLISSNTIYNFSVIFTYHPIITINS